MLQVLFFNPSYSLTKADEHGEPSVDEESRVCLADLCRMAETALVLLAPPSHTMATHDWQLLAPALQMPVIGQTSSAGPLWLRVDMWLLAHPHVTEAVVLSPWAIEKGQRPSSLTPVRHIHAEGTLLSNALTFFDLCSALGLKPSVEAQSLDPAWVEQVLGGAGNPFSPSPDKSGF